MISERELAELKGRLKRMLAEEELGQTIRAVLASVPSHSAKANALCLLQGRFYDLRRDQVRGLLTPEDVSRSYARIRADVLAFIEDLKLEDFRPALDGTRLPPDKTGHLLYAIPHSMPLERESRCLVRLAFEAETLLRDLETPDEVTTKPVRIAEIMDVALIDPNGEETFQIRSISSPEQFVDRGDYSEWVFMVRPLRAGSFPLLLRIAVIEVRQGRERRKEIVLEEVIEVLAGEAAGEEPAFKNAGQVNTLAEGEAHEPPEEDMDYDYVQPPSPRTSTKGSVTVPPPEPAPELRPRSSRRSWLTIAASIALLVSIGLWTITRDWFRSAAPVEDTRPKDPDGPQPIDRDTTLRDTLRTN